MPRDDTLELQSVRIGIGRREFNLANVYIPPVGSCARHYPSKAIRSRLGVRPTSPDISFCSASLATETVWRAYTELQLDHKPIVVQLNLRRPIVRRPHRTFRNYKQADWDVFTTEVEDRLMALDPRDWTCIDHSVNKFTLVVTEASRKHFPAGFILDYNPTFSRSVRRKIKERFSPWSSLGPGNCKPDCPVESGYQLGNPDLPGE